VSVWWWSSASNDWQSAKARRRCTHRYSGRPAGPAIFVSATSLSRLRRFASSSSTVTAGKLAHSDTSHSDNNGCTALKGFPCCICRRTCKCNIRVSGERIYQLAADPAETIFGVFKVIQSRNLNILCKFLDNEDMLIGVKHLDDTRQNTLF